MHNILPDNQPADSLLVVEVYTDEGATSSYPSHKHDEKDSPDETYLEETYYHRFDPEPGFAMQRVSPTTVRSTSVWPRITAMW